MRKLYELQKIGEKINDAVAKAKYELRGENDIDAYIDHNGHVLIGYTVEDWDGEGNGRWEVIFVIGQETDDGEFRLLKSWTRGECASEIAAWNLEGFINRLNYSTAELRKKINQINLPRKIEGIYFQQTETGE